MAHLTTRDSYKRLVDRLNRYPQGAPPSELLYEILRLLFSEREADLVSLLPVKPFTADRAARVWKTTPSAARTTLDRLADRGLLLDCELNGTMHWALPPPMAGFFEFSLMRVRRDIDQKALAELFYQYLNVEEDFVKALFTDGETQLGRTFVNETVLSPENDLHVLDYERASEVIRTARPMAVGICYCRHKMEHLGRSCDAPMDICMTFHSVAASLIRHGIAREVTRAEGLDLLDRARDEHLVQFGENVQREVGFICNCCGCCCEAMIAARNFGFLNPVHTTNFLPAIDEEECNGCGKCVEACPVEAMGTVSANEPAHPKRKRARLDERICLGCGVCATVCEKRGITLAPRGERVLTPLSTTHRAVAMAIERGKLQNLIFDNHALASHRVMAAILGVILRLPTVKRAMARAQMNSRYLQRLIDKPSRTHPARQEEIMSIEQRLHELGIELPDAPAPAGNYVPAVVSGGHLYTAGQIPKKDGQLAFVGYVGSDLTLEDGQEAARLCCLAGLAVAKQELGSLDRVKRVVKVNGFVRSSAGFTDQPAVINGASDLLVSIFGDAGRHARAAIGVGELPLGVGVEIDFVFEVE